MSETKSFLEENIRQLLQAGFTANDRPSHRSGERAYQQLQKQLRSQVSAGKFSHSALGFLCGLLFLVVAWIALKVSSGLVQTLNNAPLVIMGVMLLLNMISIPIAGYIIVKRRRHV